MHLTLDPNTVRPMPGLMVVEIVEILGGMTKGGIFVPGTTMDHVGKDTCVCKVLRKGDPPRQQFKKKDGAWATVASVDWPEEYRAAKEGDVVVMPRDVELVFVWEERRYALVREHEAIVSMSAEDFARGGFEVVPWKPGQIGSEASSMTDAGNG